MYRRRTVRKVSRRGKRNLFITIVLVFIILYVTFVWILPNFVNALGLITSFFKPHTKLISNISENPQLAPPVFNIPYEATNTAQIMIEGYAPPNSKVNLYIDDEKKQTEDVSSEGKFLFKDIQLSLGTNNIYGKTEDDQDKESLASKILQVIYDDEKPKLEVSYPQDGIEIHGERKVTIEGLTKPDVKIFINGSQIILDKEGRFRMDQSLNDGENIFVIKVVDKASNETETERRVQFTP